MEILFQVNIFNERRCCSRSCNLVSLVSWCTSQMLNFLFYFLNKVWKYWIHELAERLWVLSFCRWYVLPGFVFPSSVYVDLFSVPSGEFDVSSDMLCVHRDLFLKFDLCTHRLLFHICLMNFVSTRYIGIRRHIAWLCFCTVDLKLKMRCAYACCFQWLCCWVIDLWFAFSFLCCLMNFMYGSDVFIYICLLCSIHLRTRQYIETITISTITISQ